MTAAPRMSIVMGVFNGQPDLVQSVESVLSQEGVDFEFIIVDDGSTDGTRESLDRLVAADTRIRCIRQANGGLTRALIRGCAAARGAVIARHDCGDVSLPGRLRIELAALDAHPEAAFVSCAVRFVGPEAEPLYEIVVSEDDAANGLGAAEIGRLRGPAHHGSTMFRRELYERVGGYREQFYFAQDLDLWMRLAELGRHVAVPTILYQAKFALGSISGLQRNGQIQCANAILECARLRRSGESDRGALARAAMVQPLAGRATASDRAAALYFVGTCLRRRGDARARRYFREALRTYPLHLRSALRLITG